MFYLRHDLPTYAEDMNNEDYLKRTRELSEVVRFTKQRHRGLKLLLLQEFGICFWCGIVVKDYGLPPNNEDNPPDAATIDHLVSRFYRGNGEFSDRVLACYHCNQKRAQEENRRLTREHNKKLKTLSTPSS